MKLKIAFVGIILVTMFSAIPVSAAGFPLSGSSPEIEKAVSYLKGIQKEDGSVGSYSDSAWVAIALSAAGIDPAGWGNPSIMDYLKSNPDELIGSFNLPADLARNILAIVAGGQDPYSFGNGNDIVPGGNYIAALLDTYDGSQFGIADSINEDCWSIIALSGAGYTSEDEILINTSDFIKANQGVDNGWSWAAPLNEYYYESDPDNTAAAIMALTCAGEAASSTYIASGLDYLKGVQQSSGGFSSYGVENTGSTAWVISALNSIGENPLEWKVAQNNPVAYLISMQAGDGSFKFASPLPEGYFPMPEKMTGDSIIALTGSSYPVTTENSASTWLWLLLGVLLVAMIIFLWNRTARK
ncbi:MAG: terpene cyclase/mutase family protein [Dehalococcoidaceae bacterium]|nr:terpene cyclase/mutase family protein [Dehalococcoidaceae bacterium]